MKEAHIMSCKLCKIRIANLMLHQFERAVLIKEYAEMRQEEKKERRKAKLKNWYQQSCIKLCLHLLTWLICKTFIQMLKCWRSYCYDVSCKKTIRCYEDSKIEFLRENAVVKTYFINYEWCMFAKLACEIRLKKLISE